MSQFYKDNTERIERIKKLLKRMTKKNWTAGKLIDTSYDSDGNPSYTFCFVGHIARVLTPHLTDSDAAGIDPEFARRLDYPINYEGGRDLMYRLATVAWELYPTIITKTVGPTNPNATWEEINNIVEPQEMLIALNDNYSAGDSPTAGWNRVRRVVRETAERLEQGTL